MKVVSTQALGHVVTDKIEVVSMISSIRKVKESVSFSVRNRIFSVENPSKPYRESGIITPCLSRAEKESAKNTSQSILLTEKLQWS